MGCTDSKEEPKKAPPPPIKKEEEKPKETPPPPPPPPVVEKKQEEVRPPTPPPAPPPPPKEETPKKEEQKEEPISPLLPQPSPSPPPKPKLFGFFPAGGGCVDMMQGVLDSNPEEEEENSSAKTFFLKEKYLSNVSFVQGFEGDQSVAKTITDEQLEQMINETPKSVLDQIKLLDISGCHGLTIAGVEKLISACNRENLCALYAFPIPACIVELATDKDSTEERKQILEKIVLLLSQFPSLSIMYAYSSAPFYASSSQQQQENQQHPILRLAAEITKRDKKSALNWTTLSSILASLQVDSDDDDKNEVNSSPQSPSKNNMNYDHQGVVSPLNQVQQQQQQQEPVVEIDGKPYTEIDCLFEAVNLNKPQESGRAWYDLGVMISHRCDEHSAFNVFGSNHHHHNGSKNDIAMINSVSMMNTSHSFASPSANYGNNLLSPAGSTALSGAVSPSLLSPNRNAAATGGGLASPVAGQQQQPAGPRTIPTLERDGKIYSSRECFIKSIECDHNCSYSWVGLGIDLLTYLAPPAASTSFVDPNETNPQSPATPAGGTSIRFGRQTQSNNNANLLQKLTKTTVSIKIGGSSTIRVNAKECLIRSLNLHNNNPFAWANLGNLLKLPLQVLSETQKLQIPQEDLESYEEFTYARVKVASSSNENATTNSTLKYNSNVANQTAVASSSFNTNNNDGPSAQNFSKIDCYIRCLELDPTRVRTWNNLGAALGACGGGEEATAQIHGHFFTKKDCLVRSIELSDGKDPATWLNLAAILTSNETDQVNGVQVIPHLKRRNKNENGEEVDTEKNKFTKKDCLIEALKINIDLKQAWKSLAMVVVLNEDGTSIHSMDPASLAKETIQIGNETFTKLEVLKRGV